MSTREKSPAVTSVPAVLLGEIRQLIDAAHQRAATAVNSELTMLYWRIGQRIHTQVLAGQRAEYGEEFVATLSQQLSWSHFREILPLKRPLQREYYAEMCRIERWSVRTLRERIDSMLYERTALSRKSIICLSPVWRPHRSFWTICENSEDGRPAWLFGQYRHL